MLATHLVFFLLLLSVCNSEIKRPRIKISTGEVVGKVKTSLGGRQFSAFEGIPYAKPPIGKRRFKVPEEPRPWQGIWHATVLVECAQTSFTEINGTTGQEDCLYINVYTPKVQSTSNDSHPVIVHIHGGAYSYGSGHSYVRPEQLMDRDMVLVTFNYRLGILGFLSTEDDVVPGNNGLKDQVMALKWVQDNVAAFGGNSQSVTLTGLSAGGSAVHFHYLSPMSKGLFHRGFSQSGVALNPWSLQDRPLQHAKRLAAAVGCPTIPSNVLVECLTQKPHQQLLSSLHVFFGYKIIPFVPFGPVVENGSQSFIDEDPYVLLRKGQVTDVPWLVSNVAHEGLLVYELLKHEPNTVLEKWDTLAPYLLDYNNTLPENSRKTVAENIRKFYLGEEHRIDNGNWLKFVQIFSDRLFLVDTEIAVQLQSQTTSSPVYYFYFSYPGSDEERTVNHADDSTYFFGRLRDSNPLAPNEVKMKDVMLDMLMTFATNGLPRIPSVNWQPTKSDKLTYLNISDFEVDNIKQQTVNELTDTAFWSSLNLSENGHLSSRKEEL